MTWRRVLLAIGQAGALLLPYAVQWGQQWFENRGKANDEDELEEHLAQMVSALQERLVVNIEEVRKLVKQRSPYNEDALRYLNLAEAFVPQGLSNPPGERPVGDGDAINVSVSAAEIFKVRLVDLSVAFRYVQMAKEIAQAAEATEDDLL